MTTNDLAFKLYRSIAARNVDYPDPYDTPDATRDELAALARELLARELYSYLAEIDIELTIASLTYAAIRVFLGTDTIVDHPLSEAIEMLCDMH